MRAATAAAVSLGLLFGGDALQAPPSALAPALANPSATGGIVVGSEARDAIMRWLEEEIRAGRLGAPEVEPN